MKRGRERMQTVLGMPKRPRKMAQKVMDSDLPLRLAEEMIKVMVMPTANARNHWKAEIGSHLKALLFGISSRTNLDNGKRKIKELHYSIDEIKEHLNDLTGDASLVVEKYSSEKFKLPPNFEEGNLFDYGWSLTEKSANNGIVWILKYDNTPIADTSK